MIEIQNDELKLKEDGSNIQNNVGQNGNILANQYELVRNILRHLPMRDLLRCCKVVITIMVVTYFLHIKFYFSPQGLPTLAGHWQFGEEGETNVQ